MDIPWKGLWFVTNLLIALAYFVISYVLRKWSGFVRSEYAWLFGAFIGACGLHHLWMAFAVFNSRIPYSMTMQSVIDTVTMVISVVTAALVSIDAWRTRHPVGKS